jgi:hypothetical protein
MADVDALVGRTVDTILDEIAALEPEDPNGPSMPQIYAAMFALEPEPKDAMRALGDHLYYALSVADLITWMEAEAFDATELRAATKATDPTTPSPAPAPAPARTWWQWAAGA